MKIPINECCFIYRLKKHFSYLESEYGFKITLAGNSDVRPQTDAVVEYTSDTTIIVIDSETGSEAVRLYRITDGKKYYLTPVDIHEYLNTTDKEKELLLSINPKDQHAGSALCNQKFILNQTEWKTDSAQDKLEIRLGNYANWLKAHANLCLEGDFSRWPLFYNYKISRARAGHLRRGKDELGYARVKDIDSNWKLIKQSIFKDKLEHIEKLKKGIPKVNNFLTLLEVSLTLFVTSFCRGYFPPLPVGEGRVRVVVYLNNI